MICVFWRGLSRKALNRLSEYFSGVYLPHCSWQDVSLLHFLYWWPCTWDDTVILNCVSNLNKLIRNATESGVGGGWGGLTPTGPNDARQAVNERPFFFFSCLCYLFRFNIVPLRLSSVLLSAAIIFMTGLDVFSVMVSSLCDRWPVPQLHCYCLINFLISHLLNFCVFEHLPFCEVRLPSRKLRVPPILYVSGFLLFWRSEYWNGRSGGMWWITSLPFYPLSYSISCHQPLMELCVSPHHGDK